MDTKGVSVADGLVSLKLGLKCQVRGGELVVGKETGSRPDLEEWRSTEVGVVGL